MPGPHPQRPRERRSFSVPKTPGRVSADGIPAAAEAMVAALQIAQRDREDIAASLTHPFHSYPARLHPATARVLVDVVTPSMPKGLAIVDPFCGSGTVLVEGRAARLPVIGVDLNPLAVLVARAKTWSVHSRRRQELEKVGLGVARKVLEAGKAARRSGAEAPPLRKPVGFDPNARNRRLASWFAPHVRRELELIAAEVDEVRAVDEELADILLACLSAILYKISSRTSDTDGTWVDRAVPRGAAARNFAQRVELLVAGLGDMQSSSPSTVFETDARALSQVVPDGSAGAIITSPPYAGTYDYAEHQRLRFDFLALRHRDLDAREIGSRRSFASNPEAAFQAWHRALADTIDSIARALAPGALAAIVIGDSFVKAPHGKTATPIYAIDDVREALTDELVMEAWATQERPMLGGVERRAFADRPKAEHAILLRRR